MIIDYDHNPNLTVDQKLTSLMQSIQMALNSGDLLNNPIALDFYHPVGSYYETSDVGFNPNKAWGGTWVLDSAGKVTVAMDVDDADFDSIGHTGGSKNIQAHTHGFTQPTITSYFNANVSYGTGSASRPYTGGSGTTTDWAKATGGAVGAVSGASTGNAGNLQPYIVVNRWHRTA